MAELLSVGLDVGTTTTQLVVSRLQVENRSAGFAIPELEITDREVIYQSKVHFTPLVEGKLVNGDKIKDIVEEEYKNAGIRREDVDTGAVIVTGETSRKENARAVMEALAGFAGEFVVTTAGPDLESELAARGAGAVALSQDKRVLHMDIGGGTSNLALLEDGNIVRTGCLNVGGRLLKWENGRVSYVSPEILSLTDIRVGDTPDRDQVESLAEKLAMALEMAAGLRQPDSLLDCLQTRESALPWSPPHEQVMISFSGGVADCIEKDVQEDTYGDMGPALGRAIRRSLLCKGEYRLGTHTIRATVIGAGCHSTKLSGSTVYCRGMQLPVKNLPVAVFTASEQDSSELPELIRQKLVRQDGKQAVLALPGYPGAKYSQVSALAEKINQGVEDKAVFVCLENDMAKALGQRLCLIKPDRACVCLDRLRLSQGSFLDIGSPVGPAVPVVIKTLVLSGGDNG